MQEERSEKERREMEEFREAALMKAKEQDSVFAADLDREAKKRATIAAELTRREFEAEIGSARALELIEAENRRRAEEQQQELARQQDSERLAGYKHTLWQAAWRLWSAQADAAAARAVADAETKRRVEEPVVLEESMRCYKPFGLKRPPPPRLGKVVSRVTLDLFGSDEE